MSVICSSALPQFHFSPLQWVRAISCVEGEPPHTLVVVSPTEVQSIEVWDMALIIPPGTLPLNCAVTTTTMPVIVSVISGKLHAIMYCMQTVASCPWVASNTQCVVGAWITNRILAIMSIFIVSFKVSQVYPQLCHGHRSSQTANVFQAQPMLSFHISEAVLILRPASVEVHWPVASSLKHGPAPSIVHVAPDRDGVPTPWVYGVHSRPVAAVVIGLPTVKWEGVQVGIADCEGDAIENIRDQHCRYNSV